MARKLTSYVFAYSMGQAGREEARRKLGVDDHTLPFFSVKPDSAREVRLRKSSEHR